MMLVLTYHEIRDCPNDTEPGFYAVSPAQFASQLDLLIARGFQSLRMDELQNPPPENRVVLTFDDATLDHYDVVFPMLEKRRCRGSFFVPTAKINSPGFLTNAQIREIAAAGHEIGSHSHEHRRMDVLAEDEVRRQIVRSQEIIAEITGKKPVTFVPPGGFTNGRIRKVAEELGMRAMRTMKWGYNQKFDLMGLETIPINHYTDDKKFQKLLEPRSTPVLYAMKETLKRVMPLRQYEQLRRLAFKFWKSN